ncbi:hypothetical protein HYW76_03795 [Candidatus Pacearchaeota archaeon]|nr:hypothetical protein [Candidatus Pacearchaeota archaeon]
MGNDGDIGINEGDLVRARIFQKNYPFPDFLQISGTTSPNLRYSYQVIMGRVDSSCVLFAKLGEGLEYILEILSTSPGKKGSSQLMLRALRRARDSDPVHVPCDRIPREYLRTFNEYRVGQMVVAIPRDTNKDSNGDIFALSHDILFPDFTIKTFFPKGYEIGRYFGKRVLSWVSNNLPTFGGRRTVYTNFVSAPADRELVFQ